MEMETVQIKGVDSTIRTTKGVLENNTSLVILEKIMTHGNQTAKTSFNVELNGENSSTKVTSRSVATENSVQQFESHVEGNSKCFGHVECDAIIKDSAKVIAIPSIIANNVEANLVHEATIGKIAGEQLMKLMTLGLDEKTSRTRNNKWIFEIKKENTNCKKCLQFVIFCYKIRKEGKSKKQPRRRKNELSSSCKP